MSSLPPPPLPPGFDGTPLNHKRAIASLVCGVIGTIFFPLVLSIAAIVLGVQARQAIRTQPLVYRGNGLALAGIILGALSIAAFLVVVTGVT